MRCSVAVAVWKLLKDGRPLAPGGRVFPPLVTGELSDTEYVVVITRIFKSTYVAFHAQRDEAGRVLVCASYVS